MNTEDSEFERIEREAKMRLAVEDDDIQVYKKPWVGLTEDEATAIWQNTHNDDSWELIKRVEAKLKEKNT